MKKILYAIGLILPAITTKALAQQMKLPAIQDSDRARWSPKFEMELSSKEQNTIDLYAKCSPRERAVFLFKVLATSENLSSSAVNQIILQSKIDQVLNLPEQEQQEQLVEMIRNGGIRWGSIGDPTDNTGSF